MSGVWRTFSKCKVCGFNLKIDNCSYGLKSPDMSSFWPIFELKGGIFYGTPGTVISFKAGNILSLFLVF